MATHDIQGFKFTPFSSLSISGFTPPNNAYQYDPKNERAAIINKFNFTQEIVQSKDPKKQDLIEKLEVEVSKKYKIMNDNLRYLGGTMQRIEELNAITQIKKIEVQNKKLYNAYENNDIM